MTLRLLPSVSVRHDAALRSSFSAQSGISLISTAILVVVIGLLLASVARYYEVWTTFDTKTETREHLQLIQASLRDYVAHEGRYPCPASLTQPVDTATFGLEVTSTGCASGSYPGTFTASGREGRIVRTGAVPTRTLNLPDEFGFDSYGNRFVYALTAQFGEPGTDPGADEGAITVIDNAGNAATNVPDNIVQLVLSMGPDDNGAYYRSGLLRSPCNPALKSGQNCDFNANATFINTLSKSTNETSKLTSIVTYTANSEPTCNQPGGAQPYNVSFLVDTSGSMYERGACPASLGSNCSRIDVAHWAMRRVVMARIQSSLPEPARQQSQSPSEPKTGNTSITGFVATNSASRVRPHLNGSLFYDPTSDTDTTTAPDDKLLDIGGQLEDRLETMCPSGNTPLGIHIDAIAGHMGTAEADRPNKITVISDGYSNNGEDPQSVANRLKSQYPNTQVDIIDVAGNPGLRSVAETTGGKYYVTSDPDSLLEALYNSAGVCSPANLYVPVDKKNCD